LDWSSRSCAFLELLFLAETALAARLALAPERIFDVRIVQMTGKFGRHRHRVGPVAFGSEPRLARTPNSRGSPSRWEINLVQLNRLKSLQGKKHSFRANAANS